MPRSKHRRKPGGKSVRHPGRGKPARDWSRSPAMQAWDAFSSGYNGPFHAAFPRASLDAGFLLDLIAEACFDVDRRELRPTDKATVFAGFMEPFEAEAEWDQGSPPAPHETIESAEAALSFLAGQGMVEVAGDRISVPARFIPAEPAPAAPGPAGEVKPPGV